MLSDLIHIVTAMRGPRFAYGVGVVGLLWAGSAGAQDADGDGVFDANDVAPCDAALAAVQFVPGEGVYDSLWFEDSWPGRGDFDFDDLVIAHNSTLRRSASGQVVSLRLELEVLAAGAEFDNGIGWRLPVTPASIRSARISVDGAEAGLPFVSGESQAVFVLAEQARDLLGGHPGILNTLPGEPVHGSSHVVVEVEFTSPQDLDPSEAPFDLYLRHPERGVEVHLARYAGTAGLDPTLLGTLDDGSAPGRNFVDISGIPFALAVPGLTPFPIERTSVDVAYPRIVSFGASGGAQSVDWYAHPADAEQTTISAFAPTRASAQPAGDTTCLPPSGTSLVEILRAHPELQDGMHTFQVGAELFPVELLNFGDLVVDTARSFGSSEPDARTLVLRVSGDLTVGPNGAITAATRKRGLLIVVAGDAVVNGTLSMSARGAYAPGQDVPLGRDAQGSLVVVPAEGGAGAGRTRASNANVNGSAGSGLAGGTGGGGSGGAHCNSCTSYSGAGAAGTSWSGGSGGGAISRRSSSASAANAVANGGPGGNGSAYEPSSGTYGKAAGGGAGNGGGIRGRYGQHDASNGQSGTGGLLVLAVAGGLDLGGTMEAHGSSGGSAHSWSRGWGSGGGGSGGGAIYVLHGGALRQSGDFDVSGGAGGVGRCHNAACLVGGAGGDGAVVVSTLQ